MKWKEFSVVTEGICVEAVAGIFHKLGSGGVVIEDPQATRRYENTEVLNSNLLSPDLPDHKFVVVKAYFPEDKNIKDELASCLKNVQENFNTECQVIIDDVRDEDWQETWKQYYHTFKVGNRLVIKPAWEEYEPQEDEVIINIDPGMAFGTGIHASTRFCLLFMDKYLTGGEKVVDAGCGSGILSIAAAKLGAAGVFAMDVDDVAVKIARENTKLNGVEDKVRVEEGNIIEFLEKQQPDLIFANITAEVISLFIPEAAKYLRPGGYLFGSGIVDPRWPGVKKQLEDHGFEIVEVLHDVDWIGVAARKL